MSFLQNIYGILFRPSRTFQSLVVNYSPNVLFQGIIALLLANLVSQGFSTSAILGSFINWLFLSTLIFLAAYIFVLNGSDYWKLVGVLAFANLPLIFLGPAVLIATNSPIIAGLSKLAIMLWVFNLNLIAISSLCDIEKRKALLLYLLLPLTLSYFMASSILKFIAKLTVLF